MARKRSRSRKMKSVAETLIGINAGIQFAEPMIPAVERAMSGDFKGAIDAAKTGSKEAVSGNNIAQAAGPFLAVKIAKKIASMFGASNGPRVGKRWRLW